MRHRPSLRQCRVLIERFNKQFPVGTPLFLRKDSGTVETVVKHEAELLGGHSPVAWFEGVSGSYSIEDNRVTPRKVEPAAV